MTSLLRIVFLAVSLLAMSGCAEGDSDMRHEVTRIPVLVVMADAPAGTPFEDVVISLREAESSFVPDNFVQYTTEVEGAAVDDISANTILTSDLFE